MTIQPLPHPMSTVSLDGLSNHETNSDEQQLPQLEDQVDTISNNQQSTLSTQNNPLTTVREENISNTQSSINSSATALAFHQDYSIPDLPIDTLVKSNISKGRYHVTSLARLNSTLFVFKTSIISKKGIFLLSAEDGKMFAVKRNPNKTYQLKPLCNNPTENQSAITAMDLNSNSLFTTDGKSVFVTNLEILSHKEIIQQKNDGLLKEQDHKNNISCLQTKDNLLFTGSLDKVVIWKKTENLDYEYQQALEFKEPILKLHAYGCFLFIILTNKISVWKKDEAGLFNNTQELDLENKETQADIDSIQIACNSDFLFIANQNELQIWKKDAGVGFNPCSTVKSMKVSSLCIHHGLLFIGFSDGDIEVLKPKRNNPTEFENVQVLKGHSGKIVSLSMEAGILHSLSLDQTIKIWDFTSTPFGKDKQKILERIKSGFADIFEFKKMPHPITCILPTNQYMITGSEQGTFSILHRNPYQLGKPFSLPYLDEPIQGLALEGNQLFIATKNTLRILNDFIEVFKKSNLQQINYEILKEQVTSIYCLVVKDGLIFAGSHDGSVHIWKKNTDFNFISLGSIILDSNSPIFQLHKYANELFIATTDEHKGTIHCLSYRMHWEKSRELTISPISKENPHIQIAADKKFLIVSNEREIIICKRQDFSSSFTLKLEQIISTLKLYEEFLLIGCANGYIHIAQFNQDDLQLNIISTLKGYSGQISDLYLENGFLFSTDKEGYIKIWDFAANLKQTLKRLVKNIEELTKKEPSPSRIPALRKLFLERFCKIPPTEIQAIELEGRKKDPRFKVESIKTILDQSDATDLDIDNRFKFLAESIEAYLATSAVDQKEDTTTSQSSTSSSAPIPEDVQPTVNSTSSRAHTVPEEEDTTTSQSSTSSSEPIPVNAQPILAIPQQSVGSKKIFLESLAEEFNKKGLSKEALKKLKVSFLQLPPKLINEIYFQLYVVLKTENKPPFKDYFGVAEHAFRGIHRQSCEPNQISLAITNYIKNVYDSLENIASKFEKKSPLDKIEAWNLKGNFTNLPAMYKNQIFGELYKVLKPSIPSGKDRPKYAEDAFYEKNGLTCDYQQIALAIRNFLEKKPK